MAMFTICSHIRQICNKIDWWVAFRLASPLKQSCRLRFIYSRLINLLMLSSTNIFLVAKTVTSLNAFIDSYYLSSKTSLRVNRKHFAIFKHACFIIIKQNIKSNKPFQSLIGIFFFFESIPNDHSHRSVIPHEVIQSSSIIYSQYLSVFLQYLTAISHSIKVMTQKIIYNKSLIFPPFFINQMKARSISESKNKQMHKSSALGTPAKAKDAKMEKNTAVQSTSVRQNKRIQSIEKEQNIVLKEKVSKNLFSAKTKTIAKAKKGKNKAEDYQKFYKFHYDRLRGDHPNWNSTQITTLVSLLWKKYKKEVKSSKEESEQSLYERVMSGKEAFKESKRKEGIKEENLEGMWKRLPMESKRKWELQGNGVALGVMTRKKDNIKIKGAPSTELTNPLNFLNNK